MKNLFLFVVAGSLFITSLFPPEKNINVIQFNIKRLLNARPVSVLDIHKITTWSGGIDGNGLADGYATQSAALFNGDKVPHALPDNPMIPGNKSHPPIKLYYSNRDQYHYQACCIKGEGEALFPVPAANYTAIFLALTSAEGAAKLRVELDYVNYTSVKDYTVPDYYQDLPAGDTNFCYLLHDLAKWGIKNNMTEKDHHNIDLLKIITGKQRTLKSIKISKTRPGYLVLWAAAGVKA